MAWYHCKGCGNVIDYCECKGSGENLSDGGYAHWEGRTVYWDRDSQNRDDIHIFPAGMPPRDHYSDDHDHIRLRGATVSMMSGQAYITGGYVVWKRINGVES